jgi:hypothetical protein
MAAYFRPAQAAAKAQTLQQYQRALRQKDEMHDLQQQRLLRHAIKKGQEIEYDIENDQYVLTCDYVKPVKGFFEDKETEVLHDLQKETEDWLKDVEIGE